MNHTGTFLLLPGQFVNNERGHLLSKVDNFKACVTKVTLFDPRQRRLLTNGKGSQSDYWRFQPFAAKLVFQQLDSKLDFTQVYATNSER